MTQQLHSEPAPAAIDYASRTTRFRRVTPRWVKRTGKVFLALVIFAILFHAAWRIYAGHQLRVFIAQCSAAGEPVTPAQLQPSIPDSQNAALLWRAAATSPPLAQSTRAWGDLSWMDPAPPLRDEELSTIRTVLSENPQALASAAEAARFTRANWNLRIVKPYNQILLPDLNTQRELASLLSVSILESHHRGDDAEALARTRCMLRQSDAVDHSLMHISHLVAVGISHNAAARLQQIAPELHITRDTRPVPASPQAATHPASRQDVVALISDLLDDSNLNDGLKLGFYSERLVALDFADDWAQMLPSTTAWERLVQHSVNYAVTPTSRQDGVRLGRRSRQVLSTALASPDFFAFKASAPPPALLAIGPIHPLTFMQYDDHRIVTSHYRILTERRLAAAALAIRLYAIDHDDHLPATLNELVPRYLPAVPIDPFAPNSQPLRYDQALAIVYSLGDNGADDGGSEKSTRPDPDHWDMQDVVVHLHTPPRNPPRPRPDRDDEGANFPASPGPR